MKLQKYWRLVASVILSAFATSSVTMLLPMAVQAADGNAKQEPIKVGFIASLTGVGADPSKDMVNGIQLFLDQIHNQVAGREIKLIVANDASSPATAVAKINDLIDHDKVDVLSGLLLSNIGYAVAPVVERAQVPMVVSVSAGDDLTQRKHFKWIVRSSYTSSQASHPFGSWVYKTLGYKRIVTLGMDYSFGYETVGGFQRGFEDAGGQIVQKLWAPLGFRDFSAVLSKVRPDADALFISTTSAAAELMPKLIRQAGIKLPIIGFGSSFDEAILPHLGDEALGATTTMMYSAALDTAANKKFVAAYKAKYGGVTPSSYAENAYASGMLICKAIGMLKGDLSGDKQKLLTALKTAVVEDAPRGPFKLDDRSNPIENIYVRKVERKDGHLQNTVIATFKDVSQFWKWSPEDYLKQSPYNRDYPPCKYCSQ